MMARFDMFRDGTIDLSDKLYPYIDIEVPSIKYVQYILSLLGRDERAAVYCVRVGGEIIY